MSHSNAVHVRITLAVVLSFLHQSSSVADVAIKLKTSRREDKKASLHMSVGSVGEIVRRQPHPDKKVQSQPIANSIIRGEPLRPDAFQERNSVFDNCDDPYLLGKENGTTTECSNDHHKQIYDLEDCRLAAVAADAKLTSDWVVTEAGGWRDIRPRGCFMMPCRHNETHHNNGKEGTEDGTCYFFNPIGVEPLGPIEGIAVCTGTMFYLGKNDTNGKEAGECPEGYETILHEDPCEEAASCLDDCPGWQHRKANWNASKYNEYPLGCMVDHSDGCVYFNEPKAGRADPNDPKGVPICKIAKITHFPHDKPTARL